MNGYHSAIFQLDSLPALCFAGFSDGSDWNGFEVPYFDRETAEEILRISEANGYGWRYDEEIDGFFVSGPGGEDDVALFEGATITVEGVARRVYGIGAGSWIWGLAEL
jgi:hypothetical protein